jgi:hypothetical protein
LGLINCQPFGGEVFSKVATPLSVIRYLWHVTALFQNGNTWECPLDELREGSGLIFCLKKKALQG